MYNAFVISPIETLFFFFFFFFFFFQFFKGKDHAIYLISKEGDGSKCGVYIMISLRTLHFLKTAKKKVI
jgi:hypothetical protein